MIWSSHFLRDLSQVVRSTPRDTPVSFCTRTSPSPTFRSVPTTPDPSTSAQVSRYKWEAYRGTNWWCIYYFLPKEGILLQKYRDRNGRCIAILFKSIGVRGRFDSPETFQGLTTGGCAPGRFATPWPSSSLRAQGRAIHPVKASKLQTYPWVLKCPLEPSSDFRASPK